MSTNPSQNQHSLPARPNLRHLKNQARDLLRDGTADSLSQAQRMIARRFGFPSWPKLKTHVESFQHTGQLKAAIDENDLETVRRLMSADPDLHRAPMGYNDNGPLTWATECRGQRLTDERFEIIRWMLENGSDVHQGGDGPLMRAALSDTRIPVMDLLVSHGADVNALWDGHYPIVCAPCETLQGQALRWLVEHGADMQVLSDQHGNCAGVVLGTYSRNPPGKHECLEFMVERGENLPDTAPMAIHRGRIDLLADCLRRSPELLNAHVSEAEIFPFVADFNLGGGLHGAPLEGGTLLQMAVEYQELAIVEWLLGQGADPNIGSQRDENGFGGVTPLFHTTVTIGPRNADFARILLKHGASATTRTTFRRRLCPTHAPENEEVFEYADVTAIEFATQFQDQRFINEPGIAAIREFGGQ